MNANITTAYEPPTIEKVEFDIQSTTVLGGCQGWKDGDSPL